MTRRLSMQLPPVPMVGRGSDLAEVRSALERCRAGGGSVVCLSGEGGVGKSRLVGAVVEGCVADGWEIASGCAYAVEAEAPFGVLSDALVPLFKGLREGALTNLARGAEGALGRLFPSLSAGKGADPETESDTGSSTELFWTLARVLEGLSSQAPLLIVLEDVHWSAQSSLELLHFVARQLVEAPLAFLLTINADERERHPTLPEVERSLDALGIRFVHTLRPLELDDVDELVTETFRVGLAASRRFSRRLSEATGGNPLLIEATLATLVEGGRLRREGKAWLGWDTAEIDPPRTARDALLLRLKQSSSSARSVAEVIAVIGTRARHDTVRDASRLGDPALVSALEELTHRGIIIEGAGGRWPTYDFRHPMMREVLVSEITRARRALLHLLIADSLESAYGDRVLEHADELAFHLWRGELGGASMRAMPYLGAAARAALARFANREAADYLARALELGGGAAPERPRIIEDLGRARRRLGDVEGAIDIWRTGVEEARERGDGPTAAKLLYLVGLARMYAASASDALAAFDDAIDLTRGAQTREALIRMLVARGTCLVGVGRVPESTRDLVEALRLAEASGDMRMLARTHRALLQFHTWAGPPDRARAHGLDSIVYAEASGDASLACTCHWACAVFEGLSGNADECVSHVVTARALNEEVGSPLMRLAIAEVEVEYMYGVGDWSTAIALGEGAIELCRSLGHHALLPRLLVWTGLVHLGRDSVDEARAHLAEAWTIAGCDTRSAADVHSVVPAHIGVAACHMVLGEIEDAIRVARAGLQIVERTGYRRWAAHRLLPVLAEAHLIARDLEGARAIGKRMREEAVVLDDALAHAWADACDALILWLQGASHESADALRRAAEKLERVPFVFDALRLRRRLAACLLELDRRDDAVHELRSVYDGLDRLGAERELEKTRKALHEAGARPPAAAAGAGATGLTPREREVVDLVFARRSNKAIAKALGISPRTVDTHLTNIFKKLEVSSRNELAARAGTLPREP